MKPDQPEVSATPDVESGPRRRVRALLQRLTKATALGGAALGIAAVESACPIVCDPLPPPMTCPGPTRAELLQAVSVAAQWQSTDAARAEGRVLVSSAGRPALTFSPSVTLTGATLVGTPTTQAGSLELRFAVDAGATTATAELTAACVDDRGESTVRVRVVLDVARPVVDQLMAVTLEAP